MGFIATVILQFGFCTGWIGIGIPDSRANGSCLLEVPPVIGLV